MCTLKQKKIMNRIFQVEEMTGVRTFQSTSNGVQVDVKVAGMKLTDGRNTIYAEGFRERAEMIEKLNLQKGDVVQLHLSTSVRESTKDGVRYFGNNVTIDSCQLLLRVLY